MERADEGHRGALPSRGADDLLSLLPLDLTEVIYEELGRQRRPNDYLLHASSHISGPIRHAQLDVAGAPKVERDLISEIRMFTGTMWHTWLADSLRKLGVPAMMEVNVTPWLPDGWGGTADLVIWNPELKAFVLHDLKTTKGEGLRYIRSGGAKEEHRLQTSAYYHALRKMGVPMAKAIGILYLPMNDTRSKDEKIEPVLIDFTPIPAKELHAEMKRRNTRARKYVSSLPKPNPRPLSPEEYITDELEPGPEREQRIYFDRITETHEVKLVPPWYAAYCPFGELCSCGDIHGTTKIGYYDHDGTYYARSGYEKIEPVVSPT